MTATIHGPGEGERHSAGASTIVIKATSEDTGGTLSLNETEIEPGFPGPPPHFHETLHDMFYVLAGTLTLCVGDDEHVAGPGTFACLPPGTVHTFRNDSGAPEAFAAVAARHDVRFP